jgi:integrase/recombinase XerD
MRNLRTWYKIKIAMFSFIRNILTPKHPRTFLEVLHAYAKKEAADKQLLGTTVNKYWQFIRNIEMFFHSQGLDAITIHSIRIRHMEQMRVWLMSERGCAISHASRHLEICKRALRHAVLMEYISHNPLDSIKAARDKVKEVVHLEQDEIQHWSEFKPGKKSLAAVRDVSIFQIFTGLSYADLKSYQVVDRGGKLWIANRRAKNDTQYYVPLLPEARAIHEKYAGKLPVPSNQAYNRLIKELASVSKLDKKLTTHVFRKTFATVMDQLGVSPKTTATMMGNTVQVLEKHYVAKSPKRMEKELAGLGIIAVNA